MKLRRAAHVAWRRVGDETVLIHLRKKRMFVLNPSGGFFWQTLDGSRDCEAMLAEVDIEGALPDDAPSSLERFMERLRDAELVESVDETEAAGPRPLGSSEAPGAFPRGGFLPPELVWQEEIRNFGQSCALQSGATPLCTQTPTM